MQLRQMGMVCACAALSCLIASANDQSGARSKIDRSRLAARMLNATNRARDDIRNNNRQQAIAEVDRALDCARQLQQNNGSQTASANMVPIYTEWDQESVIAPIASRRHNMRGQSQQGQSQMAMNRNSHTGSANREANTPEEWAAVRDVEAGFTSVAVDAKMAEDHLAAAKTALQNSKTQVADSALAAVQDGVVMVSFDSDMPLLKARENLALASDEAQHGNYREASAALQAASSGLKEYANNYAGTKANDAKQLSQQISSYASRISSDHANANGQIQDWWNQVTAWTKPANSGQSQR